MHDFGHSHFLTKGFSNTLIARFYHAKDVQTNRWGGKKSFCLQMPRSADNIQQIFIQCTPKKQNKHRQKKNRHIVLTLMRTLSDNGTHPACIPPPESDEASSRPPGFCCAFALILLNGHEDKMPAR